MQKINIDKIIKKLKKTIYWKNYEKKIKKEVFKKDLNYYIGKEGIIEIGKNEVKDFPKNWGWNKFENLKKEFINLVFEEINYCPNCGKSPFLNTGKINLKSFDLDHFFPKSKFNYLMFNFYNLIPICPFCNQKIKKDRNPFNYEGNIFNPYFGVLEINSGKINFTNNFEVNNCINFSDYGGKLFYKFNNGYSNFLNLKDIYVNSQDTFNVFNFIQDKRTKIKDEKLKFKKSLKTDEEFKKYFFKNYYPKSENKILKYSNGKLKKDLIDNLKL